MKSICSTLLLILTGLLPLLANNISISATKIENTEQGTFIQFTLDWENAWHNTKNHDAAWVIVKFNPHSPISWRNYAAWAGGPRSIAYGFRCVRTAP